MATLLIGTTIGGHSAIHAGNIGSQSVNYANSAGSTAWTNVSGRPTALSQFTNDLGNYGNWITSAALSGYATQSWVESYYAPRAYVTDSFVDFYIYGDENRYYPVTIHGYNGGYGFQRYSVHRGYSWQAPWDPVATGTHKGGLTLTFEWSGDIAWGGNDKTIRVIQFGESYTNMVAGMQLAHCEGAVVWLRGGGSGGAHYRLHGPGGKSQTYSIAMSAWTSCAGITYDVRNHDSSVVNSEINDRYPIRNKTELYINNNSVATQSWVQTQAYLTSFTETDPTVPSHVKSITTTEKSNWNTAHGWGNHASAGYLTSYTETDTLNSVVGRGNTTGGNIITSANMYAEKFIDYSDNGYYVDPRGFSQLSYANFNGAPSGRTLSLGGDQLDRVLDDPQRSSLVINALYYPHLYINATASANNPHHGPVFSMTGVLSAGGYRRWGMGIANTDPDCFSWGYYDNQVNPHYGVGGTFGYTGTNAKMWLNTNGSLMTTGDMRSPQFRFTNSTNNGYLSGNSEWGMRFTTDNGFIQFGPANDSYAHIYTDRGQFYFNRDILINNVQVVVNSGTWGINVTGSSNTATYALNSTRLYASDGGYVYGGAYPYYMYMNYDGGSYWELKVSPATPGAVRVAYSNLAGSANAVAWTNVSGRPTALSQFTNDLVISTTDNTKLPLAGGVMSGRLTLKSISGVEQTVPNDFGAYLHLGDWGVGRTDPGAVLVNTAYRADYATDLFDMNISRFTNNSGYITSSGSISGNAATATTAARANRANGNFYIDDNYGNSIVGVYTSTRYQGVFAMGDSYKLPADGTTTGNLYGLAWSHPNAGGVAGNLNDHGLLVINNGVFAAAISSSIRAAVDMRAPYFYGSGSIRVGDMWGGAGLYRPSGSMVFGIEDSDWVFSKGAATQAYFAGGDGNLWMRWAGDWLSNLLGAKQNNLGFTPYNATNPAGYITSGDTTTGIFTTFLGNGTSNISSGYTRVIRNENGLGGNPNYAPILHIGASDTMWQIAGPHAGQTNLVWRSGYAGTWETPWWTIYHSGNFTNNSSNWNTAFGWGNHASAGYLTSLPSHNHDDRYYTETESDARYIQYGSITSSFGLNDNKLYLRTNGDNNHYIWNAADDWEEIVAYSGTGLRIKSSTGVTLATFSTSGNSMDITGNSNTTSQRVFSDLKINFPSGDGGGHSFSNNHYSMGLDSGNGAWSHPHYRDLIIGYHTGIRLGAHYSGVRFYSDSPTTDTNNDGNGDGGENLLMTVGGYVGTANHTDVVVNNNLIANISLRAPIFYDSNDTSYYLNPAGGSRLRNLYVGDSGDDWSDPGGWGTQVRFSNGPHVRFVLHARTPGIEAGMYVHTPSSVYIGSYTAHSVNMMVGGNSRLLLEDGRVYSHVYMEAAGSMRAPIFYDSNDTAYYLDPNGTSNLNTWTSETSARIGRPAYWTNRYSITTAIGHHTGTNGWGTGEGTWATAWKGGFSGWDIWGTSTDHPQGSGYVHAQGIISGLHHANPSTGANAYGWMMVGAHNATDNRYWLRGKWDNSTSGWVEMITTGNIGSQSVSYATTAGSATTATNFNNGTSYSSAGVVYVDTLESVNTNDWLELVYYGGLGVRIGTGTNGSKALYAGSLYDAGNRVYSAGNPQGSIAWSGVTSKPAGWLDTTNLIVDNAPVDAVPSGFYQNYAGSGNPTGTWFNYINVRHSNPGNGHGFQIGMSYYDTNLWFRSYQGGLSPTYSAWGKALSSLNHTEYMDAPNKAGTSYYQVNTWMQFNGTHGLYWPAYYDAHFGANDLSSYTQFAFRGSKNSYGGFYDLYSRVNGAMYDSGGNGGVYREANGLWYWYYHVGNNSMGIGSSTNSASYVVYASGSIYATGDIVAYSDRRKKTDIVTIDSALDKVMAMRGVFYTKIDESDKGRQVGVIAQEVNEILPEAVTYAADVDEYGVKYGNIVGVLIEAIKEQQKEIDELKAKLN